MVALAKHVTILDAMTPEEILGPRAKRINEAIENDVLARIWVMQGEEKFNDLCVMHGGVEEIWSIKESPFVSKMPEDNLHTVGHNEQIVLDLARFGMAVGKFVDSVSEGVSMRMW